MEMVAASRMRRAQEQVQASRPYAAKAWELLTYLREHAVQRGRVRVVALLLVGAQLRRDVCDEIALGGLLVASRGT